MAFRYLYRRFFQKILQINDTPESIALGTAIGVFIAMTPTVGVQMILVLIVNTMCRANRLAGVAMVYISNPVTMIPIYWIDYVVGTRLIGMEAINRERFEEVFQQFVTDLEHIDWWAALGDFAAVNAEVFLPMLVGGCLLGLLLALPAYPITLRVVRVHQRRRAHKQALLKLRELRRKEREVRSAAAAGEAEGQTDAGSETGEPGASPKPELGKATRPEPASVTEAEQGGGDSKSEPEPES